MSLIIVSTLLKSTKVTLLSKKKVVIDKKYIKIDMLEPKEVRKYEVKFDNDNVKTFTIELVDEVPEEEQYNFVELVKDNAKELVHQDFKK